jgi:hypothetical protein
VHPNANLENGEYVSMIGWLFASAQLFHPGSSLALLTSEATDLRGLRVPFTRLNVPAAPATVMLDRARAQLAFLEQYAFARPVLFLDSDMLINGKIGQLFASDFDIAVTVRDNPKMPLNGGLLMMNALRPRAVVEFFRRYLAIFAERYGEQSCWFGDQLALRDAVGLTHAKIPTPDGAIITLVDGARCLLLPESRYNYPPDNAFREIAQPISGPLLLHFKGPRKRLMRAYWESHLLDRTTPLPFGLPLPNRLFAGYSARRRLLEYCAAEARLLGDDHQRDGSP